MPHTNSNSQARMLAKERVIERNLRSIKLPHDTNGRYLRVSQYYGENTFNYNKAKTIPEAMRKELQQIAREGGKLKRELAEVVARAATEWALEKGVTHFCHWFQPLTGSTAEKQDAFINFQDGEVIEKFGASQLMQGEPDASSFPHGGMRSTFEARGYTSWDMTSPMFLAEGINGKTLCIPTAFVSYHGVAMDVKTPLLRSINRINKASTHFMNLIGEKSTRVVANCGAEQEYFLIDKAFYFSRPDLVMTGRTLIGLGTTKHQQLEDHYFGAIPERVKAFMDELNLELHRLGIPAKTQHNEVAPAQFELAPIFEEANVAADHNQVTMSVMKNVANRHGLVALLHEKPFTGINGSGKHVNWSLSDDLGTNLLEPGHDPHTNHRFLAICSIVVEAVYRHAAVLRASIAGHGNDHRLGANEAPPSVISVYLGETLANIYQSIIDGTNFVPTDKKMLDLGAGQLATLLSDNSDRNRTSPFAFTGNKFEFRAVGASQSVGFPLTILNAAVAEVMEEANILLAQEIKNGKGVEDALFMLTKKFITNAKKVMFNGDGYSKEWLKEAEQRGLPNYKNTVEALEVFKDTRLTAFLVKTAVLSEQEITMRYNVLSERYNTHREIEFRTLLNMISHQVIPSGIAYKEQLSTVIRNQKEIGLESSVEVEIYKNLSAAMENLFGKARSLKTSLDATASVQHHKKGEVFARELMPLSESVSQYSNELEDLIPDALWPLPKYYDMLFIR
ncbi:MAG TPA: glutamine synthetase type III [Bdellovibrionales bacterium]|nr:glutamine synthetase type III [Bdellovibrionales bacterium]